MLSVNFELNKIETRNWKSQYGVGESIYVIPNGKAQGLWCSHYLMWWYEWNKPCLDHLPHLAYLRGRSARRQTTFDEAGNFFVIYPGVRVLTSKILIKLFLMFWCRVRLRWCSLCSWSFATGVCGGWTPPRISRRNQKMSSTMLSTVLNAARETTWRRNQLMRRTSTIWPCVGALYR